MFIFYSLLASISVTTLELMYRSGYVSFFPMEKLWLVFLISIPAQIGIWGIFTTASNYLLATVLFGMVNLVTRMFTGFFILNEPWNWKIVLLALVVFFIRRFI